MCNGSLPYNVSDVEAVTVGSLDGEQLKDETSYLAAPRRGLVYLFVLAVTVRVLCLQAE